MQPNDQFSANHFSIVTRGVPSWRNLRRFALAGLLFSPFAATIGCGTLGGLPKLSNPVLSNPVAQLANQPTATQYASTQNDLIGKTTAAPFIRPIAKPVGAAVVAASYTGELSEEAYSVDGAINCAGDCSPETSGQVCSDPQCASSADSDVGCGCGAAVLSGASYRHAQEYIFDGGDQQPTVVVKQDWTTAGVDPTDTVIYYETLAGTVCVKPSNRVPIYAPRFGAVRQVSGLQLAARAIGTERILAPLAAERFDERNLAGTVVLPVAPHGEQQIGLIDAFQENYVGTPMDQVLPLSRMSAARVPFELVDPRMTGLITRRELVEMHQLVQNAQTWVIPEALTVEISNQPALIVKDTMAPEDLVLYETPDKCAMRICKAASHTIANSGDIVSFAIRFDNAGVKPLGNVVITDSLSPRLNYIDGSQQCSVGVRFSAEPNDVGSMILRWEIEEAVKPSDGGVITFDCQVR